MYFNQVQLIETFHLGLVGLGIIILLGGVWVVSIHSGGGGVDVGSWSEDGKVVEDETILHIGELEQGETSFLGVVYPNADSVSRSDSTRKPLKSISEPTQSTSAISTEARRSESAQGSYLRSWHRHTMYSTAPSLSPVPMSRRTDLRRRFSDAYHFSTASHRPPRTFVPPLVTVPTLGAGLQIGLSPISPGFSIVPKERRRLVGSGPGGDEEQSPHARDHRRFVSERASEAPIQPNFDSSPEVSDAEPSGRIDQERLGNVPEPMHRRWTWLRNYLTQ